MSYQKTPTAQLKREIAEALARAPRAHASRKARRDAQIAAPLPTVDEIARAIAHKFRSTRSDGGMSPEEYAQGIVDGRDAHIRWQDRMFARERIASLPLPEIANAVIAYRAKRVR